MNIQPKGAVTGALPAPDSSQANSNALVFAVLFASTGAANVTMGGVIIIPFSAAGQFVWLPPVEQEKYGLFDPTKFATSAAVNVTYFLP